MKQILFFVCFFLSSNIAAECCKDEAYISVFMAKNQMQPLASSGDAEPSSGSGLGLGYKLFGSRGKTAFLFELNRQKKSFDQLQDSIIQRQTELLVRFVMRTSKLIQPTFKYGAIVGHQTMPASPFAPFGERYTGNSLGIGLYYRLHKRLDLGLEGNLRSLATEFSGDRVERSLHLYLNLNLLFIDKYYPFR